MYIYSNPNFLSSYKNLKKDTPAQNITFNGKLPLNKISGQMSRYTESTSLLSGVKNLLKNLNN